MKKREDFDDYNRCVNLYLKNDANLLSIIKKTNLSRAEETLLLARYQFRKKEYRRAKEMLENLTIDNAPFLQAQKKAVLSNIYFTLGEYEEALIENYKALENYKKIEDIEGQFMTLYNISADYSKLGQPKVSLYYLEKSKRYCQNIKNEILLLRGFAVYFYQTKDYFKVSNIIKDILSLDHQLTFQDQLITKTIIVDLLCRINDFELAKDVVNSICSFKSNRERDKFLYIKLILNCLIQKKSILDFPKMKFKNIEYALKYKILISIHKGDHESIEIYRNKLNKVIGQYMNKAFEPEKEDGHNDIFFKYLEKSRSQQVILKNTLKPNTKMWNLLNLLIKAKTPISKEDLIELIYKVKFSPSLEQRLYKMVERLKKKVEIKIVNLNGAYFIEDN